MSCCAKSSSAFGRVGEPIIEVAWGLGCSMWPQRWVRGWPLVEDLVGGGGVGGGRIRPPAVPVWPDLGTWFGSAKVGRSRELASMVWELGWPMDIPAPGAKPRTEGEP